MVVDNNQLPLHETLPALEGLYGTRTSHRWKNAPGQLDLCNLRCIFPSVGPYDIPPLAPTDFVPEVLGAFHLPNQRKEAAEKGGAIHFFIDDYRFERVWKNPDKHLEWLDYVGAAVTPDFSIFTDTPLPTQIWQVYRNRWMGAWWQYNGITVIPAVRWAEPNTYDFSFEGLPHDSVVAVGVPGTDAPEYRDTFRAGLAEMAKRLTPSMILTYGKLPKYCEWLNLPPVREYPTFWQGRMVELASKERESQWEQGQEVALPPPGEDGLVRSSGDPCLSQPQVDVLALFPVDR